MKTILVGVVMIGCEGKDRLRDKAFNYLKKEGINVSSVKRDDSILLG